MLWHDPTKAGNCDGAIRLPARFNQVLVVLGWDRTVSPTGRVGRGDHPFNLTAVMGNLPSAPALIQIAAEDQSVSVTYPTDQVLEGGIRGDQL